MSVYRLLRQKLKVGYAEKPLRSSIIFYAGMDGLGGLEMDTEENENVCCLAEGLVIARCHTEVFYAGYRGASIVLWFFTRS